MMNRVVFVAGVMTCWVTASATAQMHPTTSHGNDLTIKVTGEAKGKPDTMYVTLAADATAGNAADAFQQCKQKADAAAKAIEDLKIPNSEVIREVYEFSSPAGNMYGMPQSPVVPSGTRVSQTLKVKVTLSGDLAVEELAGTISRVLDVANKTGVGFTPASPARMQVTGEPTITPVTYALEDATAIRMKAVANGLARAKEIKETLITSGVKVGKLLGVKYDQTTRNRRSAFWPAGVPGSQMPSDKSAVSSSPKEVTVYCSMSYTYKVE